MGTRLRAKFQVWSVERFVGSENLTLNAVYGKDGTANGDWSKYTPTGKITMTVTNEDAWGAFKPGDYVLVNLELATVEE